MTEWRKSTRSGSNGCVEVAIEPPVVLVRDSLDPEGPRLRFSIGEWRAFLDGARQGEFDPLPPPWEHA